MQEQAAQSEDLSERGVLFLTSVFYSEGDIVELRFEMPEIVGGEPTSEWLCTGHVVRVRKIGACGVLRVSVQFDCYDLAQPRERRTRALARILAVR